MTEYIDMTPTWEEIVPLLISFIESDRYETKQHARKELTRMALLADKFVAEQKASA